MMTFFLLVNQCCQKGREHVMGHRCFHKWSFDWEKKIIKNERRNLFEILLFHKISNGMFSSGGTTETFCNHPFFLTANVPAFPVVWVLSQLSWGRTPCVVRRGRAKTKRWLWSPSKDGTKKKKKLPRCKCLLQKTRSLSFPPLYPGLQIATTQFSIREAPAKYKVWCASCVLLFQMFERFAVLEFRPQATVCVLRPALFLLSVQM